MRRKPGIFAIFVFLVIFGVGCGMIFMANDSMKTTRVNMYDTKDIILDGNITKEITTEVYRERPATNLEYYGLLLIYSSVTIGLSTILAILAYQIGREIL